MMDREALRPAFEAWAKTWAPDWDYQLWTFGDQAGEYINTWLRPYFQGYCAAMESITRTASPEMPKRLRGLIREYLSGGTFTERNTQMAEIEAEYAKHGVPRP